MIKVMILDDEALPRIALRNIVEKKFTVVGTAATAAEAMELAGRTLPDVILVDIILPDLNGLEFIRNISELLPLTRYIVISNVDNTEYLRQALRLDVFDYLAKDTLSEEELLGTIDRLSLKICHERAGITTEEADMLMSGDRRLPLECLNAVLDGQSPERQAVRQALDTNELGFYRTPYCCVVLKEERQERVSCSNSILNLFREILFDSGEGFVLLRPSYNYVCFFRLEESGEAGFLRAGNFATRCITSVKKSFGLDIAAGVSESHCGEEELLTAYREAKEAYDHHFYAGLNSVNFYSELTLGKDDEVLLYETAKEALSVTMPDEIFRIREVVRKISGEAVKSGASQKKVLGICLDVIHHAASVMRNNSIMIDGRFNEMTAALMNCETLERLIEETENILVWLEEVLKTQSRADQLIRRVKSYIYTHLADPLTLESISEEVHLSPAYLGQYFKKTTGVGLKNFIMSVRIETAKKFLMEGKKTKEIAQLTGFSTESYFIQCFKSVTGTTPYSYYRRAYSDIGGKPDKTIEH